MTAVKIPILNRIDIDLRAKLIGFIKFIKFARILRLLPEDAKRKNSRNFKQTSSWEPQRTNELASLMGVFLSSPIAIAINTLITYTRARDLLHTTTIEIMIQAMALKILDPASYTATLSTPSSILRSDTLRPPCTDILAPSSWSPLDQYPCHLDLGLCYLVG